jgi:hypothetical protein
VRLIVWADRDFAFKESARRLVEHIFPTHLTHTLHRTGQFLDAGDEVVRAIRERWASPPPILGRELA